MGKYINKKKAILLTIVLTAYLIVITPLIVVNLKKPQDIRGRASAPSSTQSCGNVPTDTILIIDRSSSMNTNNKITEAKEAAKKFVDVVATDSQNRIGLVTFYENSTLDSPLTSDFTSVKNKIGAVVTKSGTCHECGIAVANQEISQNGRPGVKKAVVLLTDGKANHIIGGSASGDVAKQKALAAAINGYKTNGTVFFAIGFGSGSDYDSKLLAQIATSTGGKYYYPAPGELDQVYQEISLLLGKGLLGGFVFHDLNNNGIYDDLEPKLNGWNIQITSSNYNQTLTTDSSGNYSITGLCDGTYQIKEILQNGWKQTVPSDPSGYTVSITNASSATDKNFANIIVPTNTPTPIPTNTPIPTVTPTPTLLPTTIPSPTATASTSLALNVFQHGIGNSGDNTNPKEFSLSNKNPVNKQINAEVEIYDTDNKLIALATGKINFASESGNYKGDVTINPNTLPSGKYYLKTRTNIHLRRITDGVIQINSGQKNSVPAVSLVTGDSNNDNQLSILDYNALLDCYSDLQAAVACQANKKSSTDFNDDSAVNQFDYNLFLREIVTQPGQ